VIATDRAALTTTGRAADALLDAQGKIQQLHEYLDMEGLKKQFQPAPRRRSGADMKPRRP